MADLRGHDGVPVFHTDTGRPVPGISASQMREIDRLAAEKLGPNLFQMMENAGRNLAGEALSRLGADSGPVLALAGTGGNGGGVVCAARHLANHGIAVSVQLAADENRLAPVPAAQLAVYRQTGAPVFGPEDPIDINPIVVLDGLVGYSLSGPPRGITARFIQSLGETSATVIALDLPSGVDPDTGQVLGDAVRPTATLTLALPKIGLAYAEVGDLILADIGIPAGVYERAGIPYEAPFDGKYRVRLKISTG